MMEEPQQQRQTPYTICSRDGQVTATVYAGRPAYVMIRYEHVSESEVDDALLDMAVDLPPICCIVVLPRGWLI